MNLCKKSWRRGGFPYTRDSKGRGQRGRRWRGEDATMTTTLFFSFLFACSLRHRQRSARDGGGGRYILRFILFFYKNYETGLPRSPWDRKEGGRYVAFLLLLLLNRYLDIPPSRIRSNFSLYLWLWSVKCVRWHLWSGRFSAPSLLERLHEY